METSTSDSVSTDSTNPKIVRDKIIPKRHIARKTLCAVGHKTTQILERSKGKGGVVKFGIETMERLLEPAKSFTASKWSIYGDPLLSKLDRKLDEAFLAITPHSPDEAEPAMISASPDDELHKTVYVLYWGRLKDKFISSQWFTLCNQILMQNLMVQAVTQKVYQPAEMFYNTVTDEFVANECLEQYLEALKEKMGPTWDDRLTPLARAFYTSAKAVTAMVGAGRFMGGALQLGRSKIYSAIDDLLARWDRVLGVSDDMLDPWLPEQDRRKKNMMSSSQPKLEYKTEMEEEDITLEGLGGRGDMQDTSEEGIFHMEEDEIMESKESEFEESLTTTTKHKKKSRTSGSSISSREILPLGSSSPTLTTRPFLRGVPTSIIDLTILPWTFINQLGSELRNVLSRGSPSWFTRVDDVLLQNAVVRAISQGVIRPAEHFFNTAVDMFRSYYSEVDIFVIHLKTKLGSTWDERLITHTKTFFALAVDLKTTYHSKDGSVVTESRSSSSSSLSSTSS